MKVRFLYAAFRRHADDHPELKECVPCNEYFGPPSLGIAYMAAVTPANVEFDFRDDRIEDVGFDDDVDLVAISCFTPSAERAFELAREFRARGRTVVLGGIFASTMPDVALAHFDAVVIGEGEGVWAELLDDARRGELRRIYKHDGELDLDALPLPRIDLYLAKENAAYHPDDYPVQLSRGCPLKCDACAIPLSMGRKLRSVPMQHVLGVVDAVNAKGKLASLTEDTSFFPTAGALRHLSEFCDIIKLRPTPAKMSYVGISMPMVLATPASVFARLRDAGMNMFYLVGGFDTITRRAFTGKDPAALAKATECIKRAKDEGIDPYTSFLVGNEDDDEGTFDRMLEFASRAGVDKAEFAIFTPYPGTPAWTRLLAQGRILHQHWGRYNDANVVFEPAQLSPEALQEGYLYLWREFYRARPMIAERDYVARTVQF
ncbi:MAG: B12-binding domain-containing radical SAM protein [Sandaracinaceae bacterium]|nr:B12-binding domain-containing radical SAM protein [Sandaracinaceae bacterium]